MLLFLSCLAGILSILDGCMLRYHDMLFSEFVDDNEYSIIAMLGLWKPSHEVHFNVVKLPFWNGKWLEEMDRALQY